MPKYTCKCGKKYEIPASALGKKVQCPNCQMTFVIKAPPKATLTAPAEQSVTDLPQARPIVSQPPIGSPPPASPLVPQQPYLAQAYPAQAVPQQAVPQVPPAAPQQPGVPPAGNPFQQDPLQPQAGFQAEQFPAQANFPPQPSSQTQPTYQTQPAYADYGRPTKKKKSKLPLIIGAVMAGVLLLGGLGVVASLIMGGDGDVGNRAARVVETIDKAEVEKAANEVIAAFEDPNPAGVNRVMDWDELADRALVNLDLSKKNLSSAKRGMKEGGAIAGFHQQLHQIAKSKSNRVLSVRDVEGETRALCRFYSIEGGVTYIDFIFHRDKAGKVRAADFHSVMTGERMSETMEKIMMELASSMNPSFMERLSGEQSLLAKHLTDIKNVRAMATASPGAAMTFFKKLPAELQTRKELMMMRIQIASELDESEYLSALQDFRNRFPNDPAAALHSIDFFILQEEYSQAITSIDKLDRMVGGDQALDALKAAVHQMNGETEKSVQLLESVIAAEPEFRPAYENLIGVAFENRDYKTVYDRLVRFQDQFPDGYVELSEYVNYPQFRRTEYFEQWEARQ